MVVQASSLFVFFLLWSNDSSQVYTQFIRNYNMYHKTNKQKHCLSLCYPITPLFQYVTGRHWPNYLTQRHQVFTLLITTVTINSFLQNGNFYSFSSKFMTFCIKRLNFCKFFTKLQKTLLLKDYLFWCYYFHFPIFFKSICMLVNKIPHLFCLHRHSFIFRLSLGFSLSDTELGVVIMHWKREKRKSSPIWIKLPW